MTEFEGGRYRGKFRGRQRRIRSGQGRQKKKKFRVPLWGLFNTPVCAPNSLGKASFSARGRGKQTARQANGRRMSSVSAYRRVQIFYEIKSVERTLVCQI